MEAIENAPTWSEFKASAKSFPQVFPQVCGKLLET